MVPPASTQIAAAGKPARDAAFSAVALPLLPTIARVARALTENESDADDLVQETFLRAFRYWHTFEAGTDCRLWLSTICRNAHRDLHRRTAREEIVEDVELESLAAARVHRAARAAGLEDMYTRFDLGPAILRELARLEPIFREIIILSDVEGRSYEEIAVYLDIPVGTVRSRLYRGRRRLQESLMAYALDAGFATAVAARKDDDK
jgi:RNA polymerase sigma-70 factor, ECF subfamily